MVAAQKSLKPTRGALCSARAIKQTRTDRDRFLTLQTRVKAELEVHASVIAERDVGPLRQPSTIR